MMCIGLVMDRTNYSEVYKDGGWKEAFKVHFKTESKIGIIATLGVTAFCVTFAILNI